MSSVVLGLPKKLQPQPEAALSPECFSQMSRIFPNNVSSVAGSATLSTAVGTYSNLTFPVQEVRFSIPTGMGKNVFIDTSKSRLNFRVAMTNTTDSSGVYTGFLQSSAYSFWDRVQTINQNGVAIDDVVGLAQIMCQKNNFEFDSAERDSIFSYGFKGEQAVDGDSANILQGHPIDNFTSPTVANTFYYDYSIPLPSSLLGLGARNFCPIGALAALNVSLWTASVMPIVYAISTAANTAISLTCTLDNISIDLQYIYLDGKSASLLNLGKEYYVHSVTHRLSTGTIAGNTSGQVSALIGLRGRSVRSLATRVSQAVSGTAGSANGVFDSQLIACSQLNYFLNGKTRVPNVVHNTVSAPTTVFEHSLQAAEAFSPDKTKYGGTYKSFCVAVAGHTGISKQSKWTLNSSTTTSAASLSAFCFAEDLRVVSTSTILDGADLSQSASHYLECNFAAQNTNALNLSFISAQDIIYVIDLEMGTIEARV